jgi:hypothetical protein
LLKGNAKLPYVFVVGVDSVVVDSSTREQTMWEPQLNAFITTFANDKIPNKSNSIYSTVMQKLSGEYRNMLTLAGTVATLASCKGQARCLIVINVGRTAFDTPDINLHIYTSRRHIFARWMPRS